MKKSSDELNELTDDELRDEVRAQGLPLFPAFTRQQLIELLSGDDDPDDESDRSSEDLSKISKHFSTVTMANLFAQQGLKEDAERLCRSVLGQKPNEQRARKLLKRLGGLEAQPAFGELFQQNQAFWGARIFPDIGGGQRDEAPPSLASSYHKARVSIFSVLPTRLFMTWEIRRDLDTRAASRAGGGSESQRVLRLFSAWFTSDGIQRATRDEPIDDRSGEIFLDSCVPGATHRVAIGWKSESRGFIPVCHSRSAQTPPGKPFRERQRPLWATFDHCQGVHITGVSAQRLVERRNQPLSMSLPWEPDQPVTWPDPSPPPLVDQVDPIDSVGSSSLSQKEN